MSEHEYVYEVGLTPDDKERISKVMGIRTLNLNDYDNALTTIEKLEQELYFTPHENDESTNE